MKGKRGAVAAAEYAHLPHESLRLDSGERVLAYFDTATGYVYVKTFGDHICVEKVTERQWENAVLNHHMRPIREEDQ